ncbi:protein FAM161B [Spea bombifrons]|uniref:protein FAM161B n=1 Tax=Spea bombifrons TaxID=233779 RepID=UPI0023496A95|nr:protein FAM161B [Spea bombifrons]
MERRENEAKSRMGRLTDFVDEDGDRLLDKLRELKLTNGRYLQELSTVHTAGLAERREARGLASCSFRPSPKASRRGVDFALAQPREDLPGVAQPLDLRGQEDPECLKQFRAQPVPAHVFLPLYDDLVEQQAARRKTGVQERKDFLLKTQKPFRFLSKEEEKRRKAAQALLAAPARAERGVKREVVKHAQDPEISDRLKEAELIRKVKRQMRAKEMLQTSSAPVPLNRGTRDPLSSISRKTRQEYLGFFQQNLSFRPRTNPGVPDFQRLHHEFQKRCLQKQKEIEPTRSEPFTLRTSALRRRQSHDGKSGQVGPRRPETPADSLRSLTSLSPNTLPVYITDSARRRQSAVRASLQEKNGQETKWTKESKQSLVRQSSISRRAKAMDPHRPLSESNAERLHQNRQADGKRMNEYKEELERMKARVKLRPYLFELLTKANAAKAAECRFAGTLQQVGLTEDFVQHQGRRSDEAEE